MPKLTDGERSVAARWGRNTETGREAWVFHATNGDDHYVEFPNPTGWQQLLDP